MNNLDDWTGDTQAVFSTLGATGHTKNTREQHDYYATDPIVIDYLFQKESFDKNIWECACGEGNLSKKMIKHGKNVISTDLIDRGYGRGGGVDFLKCNKQFNGDIITNPPYKHAIEFTLKGLELTKHKLALFLKIQYLEGINRYKRVFKNHPPAKVYVFTRRQKCYKNNVRDDESSAVCYCWIIWIKDYNGKPVIDWLV